MGIELENSTYANGRRRINRTPPKPIPYNFIPRDYQLDFFKAMDGQEGNPASKMTRAFLMWHRRAGKDKSCWAYLIKRAFAEPGNYFYVFPTKTWAKKALWNNIDKDGFRLLEHIPKEAIASINNQEMVIHLTSGAIISVLGYDKDPDSIKGVSCKGIVFSEFAYTNPESFIAVMPAVRETGGWVIVNGTPDGRNHFHDLWQKSLNSDKWYNSHLQTYWPDRAGYTGLVPPEEFPHIMETELSTEEDLERDYGCDFAAAMKGSYYSAHVEKAYSEKRVSDFVYDDTLLVDTYWDLGFKDSMAVWFRQRIGNKIIFIDYFEDSGKDLQFYVNMLEEKGYKYDTHYLPHDGGHSTIQTGQTTSILFSDLLRNLNVSGYVHTLKKLGVQYGIDCVRARFSRYHFDASRCHEGLRHLELYHKKFDTIRKVYLKQPVHDEHSDGADAMRMEGISEDISNDQFYNDNIEVTIDPGHDIFADI